MSELVFTRKKIKTDRSLPKGLIDQKKFIIRNLFGRHLFLLLHQKYYLKVIF
jgi:hypothetical protein